MDSQTQVQLPKYKSHKEVYALKIAGMETLPDGGLRITPVEQGYGPYDVEAQFIPKHDPARPQLGWYVVIYKNGYKSFSPADVFEDGYTPE